MTEQETRGVLAILKVAYPNFYKDKQKDELTSIVRLWHKIFADDNVQIVTAAVESFIVTDAKGFLPHIGAIKNKIADIMRGDEMTEYEAWNLVREAISNGIYGAVEEFAKLPTILQRLVGSPNQLRTWATMTSEHLNTVVSSNFMRSYRARSAHDREYDMLPGDVKNFMSQLGDKMSMPELPAPMTDYDVNERRNEIAWELEAVEQKLLAQRVQAAELLKTGG